MTKFHINPNTGNPNVCPDKMKCKFTSEEGIIPPHYATKDEAKKAVEDQIFAAFSTTETSSSATQTSSDTSVPDDKPSADDEPRGPESFEKAVKVARKTVIELVRKKRIARVQLKKLKKKVKKKARKLKSIRSKLKTQS